ncbi:16S rRNA (guanine(527)-N(7))-methyltransferase RsmG [Tropicimonas marinistellae]|uniref:16S rRNA (guanine(527)-N(7))-methyltransferase RsmG n=1 Tax=Tropicimonas marinistellae TaxID=1739787 RepID=UPI00082FF105|nr:16S rRNA (guanine(527)-N(7))-methyltransferase RsmG [Tropicimonas marinistellae]
MLQAVGQDVSRETCDRLECHRTLLKKWNPAINLVAPSTIDESWSRHIVDSAQVFAAMPTQARSWLDFGTGGGFPGVVCAILAAELSPHVKFTFVESDKRKCAFLSTVLRETGVSGTVLAERIESLQPRNADVVSARAVAALPELLNYAAPHLAPGGVCLFPKGARVDDEIDAARAYFRFKLERRPSITDSNAVILVLGEIERV